MKSLEKVISTAKQEQDGDNAAQSLAPEKKPFHSIGWKIHNEITYRGVDWILNSTLGVAIAYWSQRTPTGQKYFGKPLTKGFERITGTFTKNPKSIAEGGKWGSTIMSIIIGGMSIIPVMMGLENKKNKHAIVTSIDEMVYGKDAVANDPKFKELHASIEHEPEKDFVSGNIARAVVLAPMIASTQIPALQNTGDKLLYTPLGKASKYVAESIGIKPKKMLKVGPDGKTNWDFIHHTIGFDFGLTFIYSFLHEYAYKAIAADRSEHKDHLKFASVDSVEVVGKAPREEKAQEGYAAKVTRREPPKKMESYAGHIARQPETSYMVAT